MEEGEYLLSHVGFSADEVPKLSLRQNDTLTSFHPLGQTITLQFDTRQRFCRGWHDLATGKDAPCPNNEIIGEKYEQCTACQNRTGFNPVFYHAKTVSPQQEARNLEPHFLYLAYFADNLVKVGISHAKRGSARLLEQGARSALVLETFPTAHIARQYEERIAALPNIYETVQLSKKIGLLTHSHSADQGEKTLATVRTTIEDALKISFTESNVHHFNDIYFPERHIDLTHAYHCLNHGISGEVVGMIGSLLVCWQQDTPVFLPLKKYIGRTFTLSFNETPLELPAQQISLF